MNMQFCPFRIWKLRESTMRRRRQWLLSSLLKRRSEEFILRKRMMIYLQLRLFLLLLRLISRLLVRRSSKNLFPENSLASNYNVLAPSRSHFSLFPCLFLPPSLFLSVYPSISPSDPFHLPPPQWGSVFRS